MKRNSIVIAVLLVFGWFVWMRVPGVSGGDAGVGQPAPTWRARTLEGQEIGSKTLAGKVVIVDFWATWCPPCRKEIPGFIALQKQYAERGLVIVGASVDRGGSEVVKKFASEQGVNYPMIMAAPEMVGAFGEVIGQIRGIPTTVVIGRGGKIVFTHVGYASKETFEKVILSQLNTN